MRRSVAPLQGNEARRKLGDETVSGLRAPLGTELYRQWEIVFRVVLIHYLNYSSEKY